uniref:non-specific protein-tyrosine kinase n=1 Tax=Mesocestoides corti TaxID=53468 RepID=A0A5K3FD15_MESCO
MSSSDWLRSFLDHVQLPDFYEVFRDVLQVTQLQHFDYVRTSDLQRIGLSGPAIGRVKEALNVCRENAGLPKNRRRRHHYRLSFGIPFFDLLRYGPPRDVPILTALSDSVSSPQALHRRRQSDYGGLQSSTLDDLIACQLIRPDDITLHEKDDGRLGSGSFGVVRRADWRTPAGKTLPVALKILRRSKTKDIDFFSSVLSEVMLMQSVSHPNLVRIYGIIPLNPLVIVTELAPQGSLLATLRSHSHRLMLSKKDSFNEICTPTAFSVDLLWDMGIQLARGMSHLASRYLVHRDLAARNVLLFSGYGKAVTVKIGDFGLLRRVACDSGEDPSAFVYVGHGKQRIPFAWSPPEAIRGRRFSQASDVWSWGVTLWEIWTGGGEPWAGLSSDAVLAELNSQRRLAWPRLTCPRKLYQLMLACWRSDAPSRPSFEYLAERLDKIRPGEVVATQNFDEADRMDVVAGDRIVVIDGQAENFWWRGQNRRTGEIASFPREIVRLQRNLSSQDISRPMQNSFVHAGHHGFEGRDWGHVDRVDPVFLSGITPHHADTLGQTYVQQASNFSISSSSSWKPLRNMSAGGLPAAGGCFGDENSSSLPDDPQVGNYDEAEEDERRLLDASTSGTIARQQLPPPPLPSNLSKGLESSLRSEYYSLGNSTPATIASTSASASRSKGEDATPTASSVSHRVSNSFTASGAPDTDPFSLIDFHHSADGTTRCPTPSAPIYQFAPPPPPPPPQRPPTSPYFQAAWNCWMRSGDGAVPRNPPPNPPVSCDPPPVPHRAADIDRIRVLFDAQTISTSSSSASSRPVQQREQELLVGAAASSSNPFLQPRTSDLPQHTTTSRSSSFSNCPPNPANFVSSEGESGKSSPTSVSLSLPVSSERDPCTASPDSLWTFPVSTAFDPVEVDLVAKRLPGGCSLTEARDALNCAINSPRARSIIHLHSPPPLADVMAPGARDWRVKVAVRLLLLRRLVRLQLCTDLELCWSALEKADWSVEGAVNFLIYG